jgi:hypothetical protein
LCFSESIWGFKRLMQAINLEKEKKKGQGDRSAVWASNQPRRRPGGGWKAAAAWWLGPERPGAAAGLLLGWCSWALASRWARPSGQGAGWRRGARPAAAHGGLANLAHSPLPSLRSTAHRAHPGSSPPLLSPVLPIRRRPEPPSVPAALRRCSGALPLAPLL